LVVERNEVVYKELIKR